MSILCTNRNATGSHQVVGHGFVAAIQTPSFSVHASLCACQVQNFSQEPLWGCELNGPATNSRSKPAGLQLCLPQADIDPARVEFAIAHKASKPRTWQILQHIKASSSICCCSKPQKMPDTIRLQSMLLCAADRSSCLSTIILQGSGNGRFWCLAHAAPLPPHVEGSRDPS